MTVTFDPILNKLRKSDASSWLVQKESISSGETFTIPSGYQMVVYDQLSVAGTLNVTGRLVIIPDGVIP